MPGYNHYANCTCGWCINYGGNRIDPGAFVHGMHLRDALVFLERNSARYISGCFVNPNARCPVCSAPVFFYANNFGSRVYFDELGPPWPKHPCTDNPRRQIVTHGAPTRRSKGLMQELITVANTAGLFRGKVSGVRAPSEWTLLVIASIERRGEENTVKAEFLDSLNHEVTEFNCFSSGPIFQVGDFVSMKGSEISFLDRETLTPIDFVAGGSVPPPPKPSATKIGVPTRPAQTAKERFETSPKRQKRSGSKYEITKAEMKHFQSGSIALEQFCAKLRPVVKTLAREGTRKPRDVALRLRFEGFQTACGDKWTPRLVHFLLGFIFNDDANKERSRHSKPAGGDSVPSKGLAGNGPRRDRDGERRIVGSSQGSRQPLTAEEITKRKAALKRVARSQNSKL